MKTLATILKDSNDLNLFIEVVKDNGLYMIFITTKIGDDKKHSTFINSPIIIENPSYEKICQKLRAITSKLRDAVGSLQSFRHLVVRDFEEPIIYLEDDLDEILNLIDRLKEDFGIE